MKFDINEIRELAEIMSKNKLTKIKLEEGNQEILLEAAPAEHPQPQFMQAAYAPLPQASAAQAETPIAQPAAETTVISDSGLHVQKSPLVGTAYLQPAEGAAKFVEIGSTVKKGDIVMIIESMKVLNEIAAEVDGTVAEICVTNEQVVEFGQPIIKLK